MIISINIEYEIHQIRINTDTYTQERQPEVLKEWNSILANTLSGEVERKVMYSMGHRVKVRPSSVVVDKMLIAGEFLLLFGGVEDSFMKWEVVYKQKG